MDASRWRPVSRASFSHHRLDDEVVVFDDRSADTHLLTGAAARVWCVLLAADGGMSEEQLAAALSHGGAEDNESAAEVIRLLAESALIEAAQP